MNSDHLKAGSEGPLNDPTNSRYRYLAFKGAGTYRRFCQEERKLTRQTLAHANRAIPAHGSYGSLLFRPQWRAKREEILKRDAHVCVVCGSNADLQVHHRQYHFVVVKNQFKLPWDYPHHLLITLCEGCHKRGHAKFKIPTINI